MLNTLASYGQKDSIKVKSKKVRLKKSHNKYNPLSPSKAAFYSMILPGAGQIYNKRYWWQLPLIYGGLGYSIYSYSRNNKEYNRYRTAFKRRKAGLPDEFTIDGFELISESGLERAQEKLSQNRNYSLLSAVIIYALQIVEASVRAHLLQFETDNNLSITPSTINDFNNDQTPKFGLTLKYNF